MAYWVVSPNIGNHNRNAAPLRFWIETALRNRSAYMGWGPNEPMGERFAEIAPGDVILIAHGSMRDHGANRRLVACGKVERNFARRDRRVDDRALRYRHTQYATLNPFLPLDEDPTRCGLPLEDSLHDGNPQPPAIFELDPDDQRHPGNRALCAWLDRQLDGAAARRRGGAANPPNAVTANSVRIDANVNCEPYEVANRQQVITAKRDEQQLVNEFVDALRRRQISAERLRYDSGEGIFYCDVYVGDRGHLIEAKSSTSREDIRMAIGQLFDYKRLTQQAGKVVRRVAVLLPERPATDMLELLTSLNIGVIWRNGRAFSDNCGGALVR